jgi:hypothetical protein
MQVFIKQRHLYCMKDKSIFKLCAKNIHPLLQCRALWTTEVFFTKNKMEIKRTRQRRLEKRL